MYVGYTDGQIAAIAEVKAAGGEEVKGSENIWLDICRCIWIINAKLGEKRRIRAAQPPSGGTTTFRPSVPRQSKARKDRPRVIDRDGLHQLYHHTPDLSTLDRAGRAALAQVSLPTLDRLEAQLKQHGILSTCTEKTATGWASRAIVLVAPVDDDKTPPVTKAEKEVVPRSIDDDNTLATSSSAREPDAVPNDGPKEAVARPHDEQTPVLSAHAFQLIGMPETIPSANRESTPTPSPPWLASEDGGRQEARVCPPAACVSDGMPGVPLVGGTR
jgi:hypothetical protein